MSKGSFNLDEYVDVAERIRIFRSQYPDGSLQSRVIRWPFEGNDVAQALEFVAVEARAYRTPEDQRPGYGLAWEPFPGRTPYTKDSELMVAETSAWGRAIVAVLAADTKRGVASKNEIRNRKQPASRPTWDDVETEIKASGEARENGEGSQTSPGSSEGDGAGGPPPGASPSDPPTEEQWQEALGYDITRARALAILVKAGQPLGSSEDITARQLESIVRPLRDKARV